MVQKPVRHSLLTLYSMSSSFKSVEIFGNDNYLYSTMTHPSFQ